MLDATEPNLRYRVVGMDCSSCAAKITNAVEGLPGVESVKVSIASQIMSLRVDATARAEAIEHAVEGLGYQLGRMGAPADESDDDDDRIPDLSHTSASYKRALWIVVGLNVGYGLVEIIGGFMAGSQALKADALDFLGDGVISFLGLIAIGWGLAARAKAALLQGAFLGMLGVGVVVMTIYRVFVQQMPEAQLMGGFAFVALLVNLAAAAVLIPHRKGDANMRAVWLFSRNDAIGNVAVVIAAALVAWTGSVWPDLVVAVAIAALFLQSSAVIIRDARQDLRSP